VRSGVWCLMYVPGRLHYEISFSCKMLVRTFALNEGMAMKEFHVFKDRILAAAKESSPCWVTFEYPEDCFGYDERFVFESVSALKSMRILGLEIHNAADRRFSARFLPVE